MIQNQLMSVNTLLAATILKVGTSQSMQSPGIAISNKFASPDVVMTILEQLTTHSEAMMDLIRTLKDEPVAAKPDPKEKLKGIALSSILIVSGIFIGFCIFKQFRIGKQLI